MFEIRGDLSEFIKSRGIHPAELSAVEMMNYATLMIIEREKVKKKVVKSEDIKLFEEKT